MCFWEKLELFQVQLGRVMLINYTCFSARKMEFPDFDFINYAASIQKVGSQSNFHRADKMRLK